MKKEAGKERQRMEARKVYVNREDENWTLSYDVPKKGELASIRHLEADVRDGSSPFLTWVLVEEGIYYWDDDTKQYISSEKPRNEDAGRSANTVASIMLMIGIFIMITGTLVSFVEGDGDGLRVIVYIVFSFIGGMLFVGFAEIIKLLHAIANKK